MTQNATTDDGGSKMAILDLYIESEAKRSIQKDEAERPPISEADKDILKSMNPLLIPRSSSTFDDR